MIRKNYVFLLCGICSFLGCGQKPASDSKEGIKENVPYFQGKVPDVTMDIPGGHLYHFNLSVRMAAFLKEFQPAAEKEGFEKRTLPNGIVSFRIPVAKRRENQPGVLFDVMDKTKAVKGSNNYVPGEGCLVVITTSKA